MKYITTRLTPLAEMVLLTNSLLIDLLLVTTTAFSAVYAYFQWAYRYWARRGCPFLPPKYPTGTSTVLVRKSASFTLETVHFYNEIKKRGLKFAGIYLISRPVLVVVDPDYIRDILSKDFAHFVDRGFYYNEKDDPVSAHLFALDSSKWKNMRNKLTPTFTSGKMKMMFPMVMDCSEFLVEALERHADGKSDIDIREYLASFTTDVIGTCAFGIDCNSFKEPNSTFRHMGDLIFKNPGIRRSIELMIIVKFPQLALKLGVAALPVELSNFIKDLVQRTVKYREENSYQRPDFLQLLIDMKNSTKATESPFTMDQLAAQVFVFFIAGFDTSSTTMSFTLYELCRHPDIQERVREEIIDVLEKHDGKITYESLGEMKYLQQVIDESQRLFPPVVNLARNCVKDYRLRDTNVVIEKGTTVVIPVFAMHRDADCFPDPEKFDPDRFSAENKSSVHPYSFLPFGEGPRNCIGLRFGLMQSKIGLVSILKRFRLKLSPSTKLPLRLDEGVLLMKSIDTVYVTAEKL